MIQKKPSPQAAINEELFSQLVACGIRSDLAKIAAKQFIDFGEAVFWCSENEEMQVESTEKQQEVSSEDSEGLDLAATEDNIQQLPVPPAASRLFVDRCTALFEILSDSEEDSLSQIYNLWKAYLERVADMTGEDYLSLEHLGMLLRILGSTSAAPKLMRPMPTFLTTDRPNMLLCPARNALQVLFSIYMNEEGAPLPTAPEVLLCSGGTTMEDVEIFWNRAVIEDPSAQHKIYCLVWTDQLQPNMAHELEQKLRAHMEKQGPSLEHSVRLVCISSSEAPDRLYFLSSVEFFYLDYATIRAHLKTELEIRNYLKRRLQVDATDFLQSASVDPEACCVRLVTSERAGMGKSLYLQRQTESLKQHLQQHNVTFNEDLLAVTIPIHKKVEDTALVERLFQWAEMVGVSELSRVPSIVHVDISREVQENVDRVLFALLILGQLRRRDGFLWVRNPRHLYIVENTLLLQRTGSDFRMIYLPYISNLSFAWETKKSLPSLSKT